MSMIIRKLEMQGFKSFAERTKVVFHPGITAVVGPNGTGKSNLLDSLLWATGGTRTRSVRGDRIDDVIFNGNAKRAPLNMADVVLTLGDGDEELVISHRVFRNGEGEYKMNGKAVRLKDIQDELWRHQIGEKEYFVIEQGSIGTFVTSKPAEKRLFIEEAAGTAFYKDKRRQAQNKLDNTEQNLTRLEDIIMEVEKQKNSLQRQAQAANRYRRLRERIRELSSTHYCRKLAELENLQTEACKAHAASLEKENAALAQLKDVEKELTDSRGVLWTLEKSLQETQEKLYGLRSRLDRQENEIENDARRIDESGLRIQQAGRDRDELLADLLRLTKEMEETRGQTGGLEEELAARQLEVEQACSGLRIFVGIFALAFAYVILVRRAWWERVLLLISALPIALVANSTRIVVTGLLYQWVSGDAAHKFTHDISGWVMIPYAALLFALVLWYLDNFTREMEAIKPGEVLRDPMI